MSERKTMKKNVSASRLKKVVKYTTCYCPDCGLFVRNEGTTLCLCDGGHWVKAKWVNEDNVNRKRGEKE